MIDPAPTEQALLGLTLPGGIVAEVPSGITGHELVRRFELTARTPIMAIYVGNRLLRLGMPIVKGGAVRLVEHASIDGVAIYERSVVAMLVYALRNTFPTLKLYVNHSIDGCLFCEMHMTIDGRRELVAPSSGDLDRLNRAMRSAVEADLPLVARRVTKQESVEIFLAQNDPDKAELLSYRSAESLELYEIGGVHTHFFGYLAPSTGVLRHFRVIPYHTGFLMQLPRMGDVTRLEQHRDFPKLYKQYAQYEHWVNELGVPHVPALNRAIAGGTVQDIILTVEALHEKRFARAADKIMKRPVLPRVLCIAGPSSSGKTTSAKRLRIQLKVNGIDCVPVSLDDYFVDRAHTPRDEKGDYDFEAFEAIDAARINQDVARLIAGEEVMLPKFDFKAGCGFPHQALRLRKNQVLLLEGIHGLNPKLLSAIPDSLKFRLYISPITALNLDNYNRIRSSDVRVLRRMVRDHQFRGYAAEETLKRWPSVRSGEERHIFPFQREADFIINTSLLYEIAALKPMAEPLLQAIDDDSPVYSDARKLLNLLSYFLPVVRDHVPTTSILREFLGNSVFSY